MKSVNTDTFRPWFNSYCIYQQKLRQGLEPKPSIESVNNRCQIARGLLAKIKRVISPVQAGLYNAELLLTIRCRNRDSVSRNDFRLITEYLAFARIHDHFEPIDVVGAVVLVVTKSLNTSEVLQTLALVIQKWLVDTMIVRIAMHVGDRFFKSDRFPPRSSDYAMVLGSDHLDPNPGWLVR